MYYRERQTLDSESEAAMNALYRALKALEQRHDSELLLAYRAFLDRLEVILTPAEVDTYAASTTRGPPGRSGSSATSAEGAVKAKITADAEAVSRNRKLVALLADRQRRGMGSIGHI